jgi:hypothetical protein
MSCKLSHSTANGEFGGESGDESGKDDATEPYTDIIPNENPCEDFHENMSLGDRSPNVQLTQADPDDSTPINSQTSYVPCSLSIPSTPEKLGALEPFEPVRPLEMSRVMIPDTPESGKTNKNKTERKARHVMSKEQEVEQIRSVTEYLEQRNYTVFTHETKIGNFKRTMHLGFFMYEESNHSSTTSDDESHQAGNA